MMAGLLAALLAMTLVASVLRWRGRSEADLKLAADFGARTLGWWIVVLGFMPAVLAGGVAVLAVFALAAILTWLEFGSVTTVALRPCDRWWAVPLVVAHFLAVAGVLPGPGWWPGFATVALILLTTIATKRSERLARIGWQLLGFAYCVLLLSAAPAIAFCFGARSLFFVIVVVQVGDVLQYISGKTWGRRPLAPWLSPKKTWEGLLGGLAGTALIGAALAPLIHSGRGFGLRCGLGLGLAGTIGGLAMSAVKRRWGVKDFGSVLPGHGGLLDRLDSLTAAVAVAYVWLVWCGAVG